ncbi:MULTISPECIES: DoxX family protein [unclassified Sphingomonas]|uniref:DoxX family protein n=1 Tax=unclassified Sphingomonas TaxID=196159 RepID=UPI0021514316|nr:MULTISPECIES: DoxX family protein [unclassified Sphingomonas]MCR5872602.1 DoxX family protein [Sphingomonas sp. J344]UUX99111.1 DoxX family protein [Sphingomonas sp. J315]
MAFGLRILARLAALLLAAAFSFFGYFKSFAPRAVLEQHHAWTTALPDILGRAIGLSELLAAALLLIFGVFRPERRRIVAGVALYAIANQAGAALVHILRGEIAALPQNAVLTGLAVLIIAAARSNQVQPEENMG